MSQIDHNDLDGASVVARRNAGFGGKVGTVAIGLLLAAGLLYVNWPADFGDTAVSDEEFGTGQYSARDLPPSFEQSQPPAALEALQQSASVEQSVQAGRDLDAERRLLEQKMREEEEARLREEARKRAEAERLRREQEQQALWERLRSSQIVTDATEGGPRPDNPMSILPDGQLIPVPGADTDANKAFLAQAEMHRNAMAKASRNPRTDALIAEGTVIRGFLETAINTDLPGLVRAVVREDVRSLDGQRILIPKGARLVGEYKSDLEQGQARVFIVWSRIIRTDGVSVDIGSPGADNLGRAGMPGRIDRHWLQRFGSAIMLSVIGSGVDYVSSLGDRSNKGTQVTVNAGPQAGASAASSLGKIAEEDFKRAGKIPPTINVDQGSPVIVLVRRDLDFSDLYADPVQEELARLRRGGKPRRAIDPVPLYLTPKDNWFPPIPEN